PSTNNYTFMSLLKYIDRLKHMDDLIRRKATGGAEEFAEKLSISKTQLFEDLKEVKELGAPITLCSVRKRYQYEGSYRLVLRFEDNSKVNGGKTPNYDSGIAGVLSFTFTW